MTYFLAALFIYACLRPGIELQSCRLRQTARRHAYTRLRREELPFRWR